MKCRLSKCRFGVELEDQKNIQGGGHLRQDGGHLRKNNPKSLGLVYFHSVAVRE